MAGQLLDLFKSFNRGLRLIDGEDLQAFVRLVSRSSTAITALAGGGAVGATPLVAAVNDVTVVASANDSVALPPLVPGMFCVVNNRGGGNSLQVFGNQNNQNNGGAADQIIDNNTDALAAAATGVALADTKIAIFFGLAPGIWKKFLTA